MTQKRKFIQIGETYVADAGSPGVKFKIIKQLGQGGQGTVYLVEHDGKQYAYKHYHPQMCSKNRFALINKLVLTSSPHPSFIWPIYSIKVNGMDGFGYIMNLIPPGFVSSESLIQDKNITSAQILKMFLEVYKAFRAMHIHGFSYKDANFGGIHYNKATGKVIIVDVDNTTFAGNPENKSNVYFPGLGAPEVVRGEPCTPESDLHSLACMLYVLLVRDYPFEGKATESVRLFNDAAHKKFYANSPVFVYHPTDNSNGPSATLNKSSMVYWPRLPQELRDMFIRTFVDGLTDPTKRPRSFEWVSVITDVINSMYPCNHCSTIVYYRPENLNADKTHKCTRCAKNSTLPIIFALPKNKFIFVTPSTSITVGSYLAGSASADAVVAQVVENPAKPGVYGLRNETDAVWTLTKTDGNTLDIPPGRAAPLLLGSVIKGFVANAEFTCAIKRVGE